MPPGGAPGPQTGRVLLDVPRYKDGHWRMIQDDVTREEAVAVSWSREGEATVLGETTLWAWPHEPELLALGHTLLDAAWEPCGLHRAASAALVGASAWRVTLGGALPGALPEPPRFWGAGELLLAMHDFISEGGQWDDTGCFHRAGVFDPQEGRLLVRAEDIGRHNCVDRLAGWSVTRGVPLTDKALLISARMTSSLCAKALRAGFSILVSRSAVTTAAIAMAEKAGATLAGFARTGEGRFTLFTDAPGRIRAPRAGG